MIKAVMPSECNICRNISFGTFSADNVLKGLLLMCYNTFIESNIATQELPKMLQNVAFEL